MKTLFDTSTLVQALMRPLKHHARARSWLDRGIGGEFDWVVASHTLAELYSVLTTLPVSPRIAPAEVRRMIEENIERHATIMPLSARDYADVIRQLSEAGMSGGIIYDALVCHVARKAGVKRLLTLNVDHFQRVWPDGGAIIQAP